MIAERSHGLIRRCLRRTDTAALAEINAWVVVKTTACRPRTDDEFGREASCSDLLGFGLEQLIMGLNRPDLRPCAPLFTAGEQCQQPGQDDSRDGEMLDQPW